MIKCYLEDKTLLVEILSRELDHHVARYVKSEIDEILMKKQIDYIIFDFQYVNFMDSSGIGVIIGRYKKIVSHGGKIAVINMNDRLKKIFNFRQIYFYLIILIWHASMAFSAFSWLSGVTPAQHLASTMIGTSGRDAFARSALEITQMSVHKPTNVILSISLSSFIATSSPARSVEPKVSLSMGSVFLSASNSLLICQCGTGSFCPSWVSR